MLASPTGAGHVLPSAAAQIAVKAGSAAPIGQDEVDVPVVIKIGERQTGGLLGPDLGSLTLVSSKEGADAVVDPQLWSSGDGGGTAALRPAASIGRQKVKIEITIVIHVGERSTRTAAAPGKPGFARGVRELSLAVVAEQSVAALRSAQEQIKISVVIQITQVTRQGRSVDREPRGGRGVGELHPPGVPVQPQGRAGCASHLCKAQIEQAVTVYISDGGTGATAAWIAGGVVAPARCVTRSQVAEFQAGLPCHIHKANWNRRGSLPGAERRPRQFGHDLGVLPLFPVLQAAGGSEGGISAHLPEPLHHRLALFFEAGVDERGG